MRYYILSILIDCFVNAVYLYDDRVVLTFNYKDGGKTATLQEIEGSDLFVLSAYKKRSEWITQIFFCYSFCFMTVEIRIPAMTRTAPRMPVKPKVSFRISQPRMAAATGLNAQSRPARSAVV